MIDWLNTATDAIILATLLIIIVALWIAYRELVEKLLNCYQVRIAEQAIEIDKLKRSAAQLIPPEPLRVVPHFIDKLDKTG